MEDGSFTHRKSYSLKLLSASKPPRNTKESEELCSSAGVQGAGPLDTAKRANQHKPRRDGEGWRREDQNHALRGVPFLSPPNQTLMSSACNSGTGAYPLTASSHRTAVCRALRTLAQYERHTVRMAITSGASRSPTEGKRTVSMKVTISTGFIFMHENERARSDT